MKVPYAGLDKQLKPITKPFIALTGNDFYLLNEAARQTQDAFCAATDVERQIMHLEHPSDWDQVIQEANSYSLFSTGSYLDVRLDLKSLDANTKKIIQAYVSNPNSRTLIVLRAPHLTTTSLQWLNQNPQILHVQAQALSPVALQAWIKQQLHQHQMNFDPQIPARIQEATQNNMLACAQFLEKIYLSHPTPTTLGMHDIRPYMDEQSQYSLYEWIDRCLNGDVTLALERLRQAQTHRAEPTLLLWLMAQEIRQLINLDHHMHHQAYSLHRACQAANIFTYRIPLYELALKRLSCDRLVNLLKQTQQLDERIKTYKTHQTWSLLEKLVVGFSKDTPGDEPINATTAAQALAL